MTVIMMLDDKNDGGDYETEDDVDDADTDNNGINILMALAKPAS